MRWRKGANYSQQMQLLALVTFLKARSKLEWSLLQLDVNLPGPARYFMAFGNTSCNFPS